MFIKIDIYHFDKPSDQMDMEIPISESQDGTLIQTEKLPVIIGVLAVFILLAIFDTWFRRYQERRWIEGSYKDSDMKV